MGDVRIFRPDEQGNAMPPLTDIPGRLRYMATLIENNTYAKDSDGDPNAVRTALVVTYTESGEIHVHSYGENPANKAQVVGILMLAQRIFSDAEGEIASDDCARGDAAPVHPIR
jgi:hypothetical protein